MAYRDFTPEELEKLFEIYRAAPLNQLGTPSVGHTARIGGIAEETVKSLRDKHGWEERRLQLLERIQDKLDTKREKADVKRIKLYKELEKAGVNYHVGRVTPDGTLEVTLSELIALSKHVQVLSGNPDSHQQQSGDIDLRIRCKDMEERRGLTRELARQLQDMMNEDNEKGQEHEEDN